MNYQKLDASLSAALSEREVSDEPDLVVFIQTQTLPDDEQQKEMRQLGVQGISPTKKVFTAQLSRQAVAKLSEKHWVRLLSLSQQLKPLK